MKRILLLCALTAACGRDATSPGPTVSAIARTSLALGSRFGCGLTNSGKAYCWGEGQFGQIGDGALTQRLEATAVAGGYSFATIAAGDRSVCALGDAGYAYCWGEDPSSADFAPRAAPQRITSALKFKSITVGRRYACAIATDDATYCWGENGRGQLGVGDLTSRSTPTPITGGVTFAWIGAGFFHTCGLTANGTAYCWGDDSYATLGSEILASSPQPRLVSTTSRFSLLAPGAVHTCGVTKTGETLCWGMNPAGQLGTYAPTTYRTPTPAVPGHSFVTLRAARANYSLGFTCGIEANGSAFCWGANEAGQLGRDGSLFPQCGVNETTVCMYEPAALSVVGTFEIELGQQHACAVAAGGRVFCWGANASGELGDGTTTSHSTPTRTAGSILFP